MTFDAARLKTSIATCITHPTIGRALAKSHRQRFSRSGVNLDFTYWPPRQAAQAYLGLYERAEAQFTRRYAAGSRYVLELGASRGFVTATALTVADPSVEYVAVEANAALLPGLRDVIAQHSGATARVELVHAAISSSRGTARFRPSEHTLASRLGVDGEEVPSSTPTDICIERGWQSYALISDIEGAEASFILDPGGLVNCTLLVAELHRTVYQGNPVEVKDLLHELIESHSFRLLDRRGPVVCLSR